MLNRILPRSTPKRFWIVQFGQLYSLFQFFFENWPNELFFQFNFIQKFPIIDFDLDVKLNGK